MTKIYTTFISTIMGIAFCLFSIGATAQCLSNVGVLETVGEYTSCQDDCAPFATSGGAVNLGGGLGIYWSNLATDGTGGLEDPFLLPITNATSMDLCLDPDLGGFLSGNNLPPLAGTWVFYGFSADNVSSIQNAINTVCTLTEDSIFITFATDPAPDVTIDSDGITFTANATGGTMPYTFAWSTGETSESITNLTSNEQYSVLITDANGCNASASLTALPSCNAGTMENAGMVSVCFGNSFTVTNTIGTDTVPPGGRFAFVLDPAPGGTGGFNDITPFFMTDPDRELTTNNDAGGQITGMGLEVLSGVWAVYGGIYDDQGMLCAVGGDTLFVDFTSTEAPEAAIDNTDPTNLIASATGGMMPYDYEWSTGELTESIAQTNSGIVFVTVTDANGCTDLAGVANCFAPVIDNPGLQCTTNEFTLSASNIDLTPAGGFGWQFIDNSTGDLFVNLVGAEPIITWDRDLGGILSANNIDPLPMNTLVLGFTYFDGSNANTAVNSICSITDDGVNVIFVDQDLSVAITELGSSVLEAAAAGGSGGYSYMWSTGETTAQITALEDGDYTVVVTDVNGCTSEITINVTGTDVEDVVGLVKYEVYPNPSNGLFNIDLNFDRVYDIEVNVMNMIGQEVLNVVSDKSTGSTYQVDATGLNKGMYILDFKVGEYQFSRKIILGN